MKALCIQNLNSKIHLPIYLNIRTHGCQNKILMVHQNCFSAWISSRHSPSLNKYPMKHSRSRNNSQRSQTSSHARVLYPGRQALYQVRAMSQVKAMFLRQISHRICTLLKLVLQVSCLKADLISIQSVRTSSYRSKAFQHLATCLCLSNTSRGFTSLVSRNRWQMKQLSSRKNATSSAIPGQPQHTVRDPNAFLLMARRS